MGNVVEQHQPRAHRPGEIQDVERRRRLIEAIAIPARIEAKKARDDQPDCRFVRNHENGVARMRDDDFPDDRERPRDHLNA